MTNNKKSKIVGNKLLSKVIDRIQCKLEDLGNVTYDINSLPRSMPEPIGFFNTILYFFFGEFVEERLTIILYGRDDNKKCVSTQVDMDAVLRATSKDGVFADEELIDPIVIKLRRAFESLQ